MSHIPSETERSDQSPLRFGMSTSSEEELTATAPRLYRLQNLELASVFIHRMSTGQAPRDVRSLAELLTHTHFEGVLSCSEVRMVYG